MLPLSKWHDAQLSRWSVYDVRFLFFFIEVLFFQFFNLDAQHGLTEFDWEVVQLKKVMIQSADETIVLTISEKINSTQRFNVCPISSITKLVTELSPQDDRLAVFKEKGITIL